MCQTRNIQAAMRNRFEFVFIDAPFESNIGPGMSPVFDDSGPFYRWHAGESQSNHLGLSSEEQARERDIVRNYLKGLLTDCGTPFVGVMAFSTGCNIATGLLLERQGLEELWGAFLSFQFALLFCGTRSATSHTLLPTDWMPREEVDPLLTVIKIPSVHIHGLRDPYLLQSRKLFREIFSSGGNSICIEFPGGHCIPARRSDLDKIKGAINSILPACN